MMVGMVADDWCRTTSISLSIRLLCQSVPQWAPIIQT